MMIDPEIQAKISIWRRKAIEGTLGAEEMREAIEVLRAGRVAAQVAAATSKKRTTKTKAVVDGDDLLSELEGL